MTKARVPVSANFSEWSASPSHKNKDRSHDIKAIHYPPVLGDDNTILCECGWAYEGPTPEHVDRAYVQHRRDVGLRASVLTITTAYSRPRKLDAIVETH
jgi:hypothetical protein